MFTLMRRRYQTATLIFSGEREASQEGQEDGGTAALLICFLCALNASLAEQVLAGQMRSGKRKQQEAMEETWRREQVRDGVR